LIEQKRIAYIVGLAAMAPVVAGARLGENADTLGSGRARPDRRRPGAAICAPNKVTLD